ncbi:MAG: DUF4837 family protein [Tannerella sp.]|jgi:hypothetical protein|nr:DUF4837 family protein [Tannerella sp.]
MKTTILTSFVAVFLLIILGSCDSKPIGVSAIGLPYEIAVTMDESVWADSAGHVLKEELLIDVPGLPQSEATMKIMYVKPQDFNGMMTYLRNVLIVDVNESKYTKVSLKSEKDKWVDKQVVAYLTSPTKEGLIDYLKENRRQLADFFTREEMLRMGNVYRDYFSSKVMEMVKNRFDVSIYAPAEMAYFKDTTNFFWTSNNANTGRMDLVIYTFPYTDPNTFTLDYLVAMRDSIMKINMPGTYPNSYMSTNKLMTDYNSITLNGKYAGVLRGLWEMEGDMMGGPFVSVARLDEVNNRVVVAEGFVYAPETDKRSYIRRIEASLYTLLLPGETATGNNTEAILAVETNE